MVISTQVKTDESFETTPSQSLPSKSEETARPREQGSQIFKEKIYLDFPSVHLCALDEDKRLIELTRGAVGGCELYYTKLSYRESIARSQRQEEFCTRIAQRVLENLKDGGYLCSRQERLKPEVLP